MLLHGGVYDSFAPAAISLLGSIGCLLYLCCNQCSLFRISFFLNDFATLWSDYNVHDQKVKGGDSNGVSAWRLAVLQSTKFQSIETLGPFSSSATFSCDILCYAQ